MISARKAWKMTMCDRCDMQAVKSTVLSIEFDVETHAKNGERNLRKRLYVNTSKQRLPATYAKILKILKKKKYKASIQTEFYGCLSEYERIKNMLTHDDSIQRYRVLLSDTYLYISW